MNNEWSLREEIIIATHRWPIIAGFGLAGIIIGLITALVWPSYQQATIELNVGLNIYQIEEDPGVSGIANPQFTFADDYKNWQMDNLNSLVYMDHVLDQTLAQLRVDDLYWQKIDRTQLKKILHVYWRNAGRWRLVAQHPQSIYARQAVQAWSDVILQQIATSVEAANQSLQLDLQLRSLLETQAQTTAQIATLESHLASLNTWREQISLLPTDEPLSNADYLALMAATKQISAETGIAVLDTSPAMNATAKEFINWLDAAILALEQKIQGESAQITSLVNLQNELATQYTLTSQESTGLSPNLIVQKLSDEAPQITVMRPIGLFVFIGGILGLILWGILWMAKIAISRNSDKQDRLSQREEIS